MIESNPAAPRGSGLLAGLLCGRCAAVRQEPPLPQRFFPRLMSMTPSGSPNRFRHLLEPQLGLTNEGFLFASVEICGLHPIFFGCSGTPRGPTDFPPLLPCFLRLTPPGVPVPPHAMTNGGRTVRRPSGEVRPPCKKPRPTSDETSGTWWLDLRTDLRRLPPRPAQGPPL